jgi:hypothetical protein
MTDGCDQDLISDAAELMRKALLLLDAAGATLAGTHLEQALHSVSEQLEVR